MNEEEKLKDLKAVYSGAVQSGEIGIANMIKGGIDLIEELKSRNQEKTEALEEWINGERLSMHCVHKDKIKAKIEVLEKLQKEFPNNDEIRIKIIAYKELLEKVGDKNV